MVEKIRSRTRCVDIGLVGKYVGLHDAYLSVAGPCAMPDISMIPGSGSTG